MPDCTSVVFDVGGVLVDFDPRHLFNKVIADEARREYFLSEIATPDWHRAHDLGRPFSELSPELCRAHPGWTEEITIYGERFGEMWAGPIEAGVAVLKVLREAGVPTYAATNWGADTWQLARARFSFLRGFKGAVVSGEVGMAKPDRAFFIHLETALRLDPRMTAYVDDRMANCRAAAEAGYQVVHFSSDVDLEAELKGRGLVF